jgi:trimethylamine--corrinoid protein Co-methyltransferase
MAYKLAQGVSFDDLAEAMSALHQVGPGGHFLGTEHTQRHFRDAYFIPSLLDHSNYEQWINAGSRDANRRGLDRVTEMLDQYELPDMDSGTDEALREYVDRRCREIPIQ